MKSDDEQGASKWKRSQGYYWVGRPDPEGGAWVVFWSHPSHEGWHLEVARFSDRERARQYAAVEDDCLDDSVNGYDDERVRPPLHLPPPPTNVTTTALVIAPIERSRSIADVAKMLAQRLPDLVREHASGITSRDVMEMFSLQYNDAVAVCRWLDASGEGKWLYTGNRNQKRLFPADTEYVEPELSTNQRTLLDAMVSLADGRDLVAASYMKLAGLTGIQSGSVNNILYALEKKGFIMLAKPSDNNVDANIYQVLRKKAGVE